MGFLDSVKNKEGAEDLTHKFSGEGKTDEELGIKMSDDFLSGLNLTHFQKQMELAKDNKKDKILQVRKDLTTLTKRLTSDPDQNEFKNIMANMRMIDPNLLTIAESFYVPPNETIARELFEGYLEDADYGLVSSKGNPRYMGRYVYPIKGFYNEVIGFSGYDDEAVEKYLRSSSIGFEKSFSYLGMNMMNYIYKKGYIIVQEGIIDTYWGWSIDEPFIGALGDSLSEFLIGIIKRFGYNVILIPDNDNAGHKSYDNKWSKALPNASAIKLQGVKDIDDWRKAMLKKGYTPEQVKMIFKSIINDILTSTVLNNPKIVTLKVWD